MRLAWAVDTDGQGTAYGYATVCRNLTAALAAAGVEWDPAADDVLHLCPPDQFRPAPDRVNHLLTMVEHERIPPVWVAAVNRADSVIVPGRSSRDALQWAGVRRRIRVVPFGLEAAHLAPVPERPSWPFRFLWLGGPDPRKGWDLVAAAFERAFGPDHAHVELVIKTSPNAGAPSSRRWDGPCWLIVEPWPVARVAALYRSAHVFAFPTRGEGWGLPALEAMAAGCLVLAPDIGGLREFFDARVGWVLPWRRVPAEYVGMRVAVPEVPVDALATAMRGAVQGYPSTAALRARARARAESFTWAATAARLLAVLREDAGDETAGGAPVGATPGEEMGRT